MTQTIQLEAIELDSLADNVDPRDVQLNYLASLAYDGIASNLFGEGPYNVAINADEESFTISVGRSK